MFVTDISRWEEYGRAHGEFLRDVMRLNLSVLPTTRDDSDVVDAASRRFLRHRLAMGALVVLLTVFGLGIFAAATVGVALILLLAACGGPALL